MLQLAMRSLIPVTFILLSVGCVPHIISSTDPTVQYRQRAYLQSANLLYSSSLNSSDGWLTVIPFGAAQTNLTPAFENQLYYDGSFGEMDLHA